MINETSLKHFDPSAKIPGSRRSPSPKGSTSSTGEKGKGKSSAKNSDDEDEDSGDEAEKLDDEQLGEIDNIYRKSVVFAKSRKQAVS